MNPHPRGAVSCWLCSRAADRGYQAWNAKRGLSEWVLLCGPCAETAYMEPVGKLFPEHLVGWPIGTEALLP